MFHFLKDLAIMGGLLEFCAFGAGALSLDAFFHARPRIGPVVFWQKARRPI
jgi:hypothetical protein